MTWTGVLRFASSNRQLVELCCLLFSIPLVFLNLELHLAQLGPRHSSVAALVHYRRVRDSAMEQQLATNTTTVEQEEEEEEDDQFDMAYRTVFTNELENRARRVKQVCEEQGPSLAWEDEARERHMKHNDLWDVVHRLVFCPIAKVASTSWFANFLAMSGVQLDDLPQVLDSLSGLNRSAGENWEGAAGGRGVRALTRYIYQPPPASDLEDLTRLFLKNTGFMMVRHPFVRLVSAYEDKMLNPHPFPFKYHHRVQQQIKKRRGSKKVKIKFPKDVLKSGKYQSMLQKKLVTLPELWAQPSFPEFVDWLIRNRAGAGPTPASWAQENAWLPFYSVCPVCQVPYTVLKLDSSSKGEISRFISHQRLPLPDTQAVHIQGGKASSKNKADRYFAELTKAQVDSLTEIYSLDLMLFDYSAKEYLELAKNNTEVEKTDEVKKKKFRGGNKKNKNRKQKGPKRKP